MIPLEHVFALSLLLFTIGAVGVLVRRNVLAVLISIELMLNGVCVAFVGFNRAWPGSADAPALDGHVAALLVVAVAAAQAVVGLAIVLALLRNRDSLDLEEASLLRW